MKKFLCLLLAAVTLMAGFNAINEDHPIIEFDLILTKAIAEALDYNKPSDWFDNPFNRALLTISLAADLSIKPEFNDISHVINIENSSYVGRDGSSLHIITNNSYGNFYLITFTPSTCTAYYTIGNTASDLAIEYGLSAICSGGYYKNDLETINDAVQLLQLVMK